MAETPEETAARRKWQHDHPEEYRAKRQAQFEKKAARIERDHKCYVLRMRGWKWLEIARAVGFKFPANAEKAYKRAFAEHAAALTQEREAARIKSELERDEIRKQGWELAAGARDERARAQALGIVLKVNAEDRKMLGLDAPPAVSMPLARNPDDAKIEIVLLEPKKVAK